MIGSKIGAAGAKRRCRQSMKRKPDSKRDPGGVAGVSNSGDGGFGKGMAGVKFFGVRDPSTIVEINNYAKDRRVYMTVKEGQLVAAITHDLFRVCVDFSYPEESLNIRNVELYIQKEALIERPLIGKTFEVEFLKRQTVKLSDDLPDAQFPLKLEEGLTNEMFGVLKETIGVLGLQCFQDLKETIIDGYGNQGRQRTDIEKIPPHLSLPEDNGSLDDRIQALKDQFAGVVAELAPSIGKSMDAKIEATRRDLFTYFKVELKKLESAHNLEDGALFFNPYMP